MNKTAAFLTALTSLLLVLSASPAEARTGVDLTPPDSAAVTVALVDELDGGSAVTAVIVRRPGSGDVILLRRSTASGSRLASAIAMLMLQRTSAPPVTRETRIQIQGAGVPAAWRANWLPRLENLVARLRRADARLIPGIGTVPAENLSLPPAAARS
ncbi:hypothetical protein [Longimicrobium terrae]|uniref:Uncharacterized protein n=1 Tax=Longimicrobium terrae TaxID=1639882 RepID=A0A841H1X1_9BACT|nr:hypothetical protein [Longimicrobium terrae]MBB4637481.1 hypothetical protein [Longimicrobium terrae]MBB6071879.1 hypothetical protein [Longimicrobium terrae]NNC30427.1 hypothetical protein [Longimicrobium terrae]